MNIAIALREEMDKSDEFSRHNFGQPVGDGFPDLAREVLADSSMAKRLGFLWIIENLQNHAVLQRGIDKLDPDVAVQRNPSMVKQPLQFLYWGIQIGRRLQREEDAALQNIAGQQA